ncbi:hypothetical protein D3C84_1124140 [compost metagenome]
MRHVQLIRQLLQLLVRHLIDIRIQRILRRDRYGAKLAADLVLEHFSAKPGLLDRQLNLLGCRHHLVTHAILKRPLGHKIIDGIINSN